MYIREIKKKNKGFEKEFIYHRLVHSYRTKEGPRQKTILNMGKLDIPRKQWKILANRIEMILKGQQILFPAPDKIWALAHHYANIIKRNTLSACIEESKEEKLQQIDINNITTHDAKTIGAEYVGLTAYKALELNKLLKSLGFSDKQSHIACLLIVSKLIHPGSERQIRHFITEESGITELLGIDLKISNNALYRISDLLIEHKEQIENHIRQKLKDLFSLKETIIFYDLTNTYFEGSGGNAKRGRSKDKRNDRPLITLGLVLDEDGFVKGSRVFPGNISEPKTLLEAIKIITKRGKYAPLPFLRPTIVLDAGIATKDNLEALKRQGLYYIVISRQGPDEKVLKEENIEIKEGITANLYQQDNEYFILCKSKAKLQKEQAIISRARKAMEKELEKIKAGLSKKGGIKNYQRIAERIGRLRERYKRVSSGYRIEIKKQEAKAVDIVWEFDESNLGKPYDGSYYLRTNRVDLSAERIWSIYVMLTRVEDAFRSLKSELGFRPVHHSKKERIEGHLFVSVLSYHLLSYIQYLLKRSGINHRWGTILSYLRTHQVVTTTLPKKDGCLLIRGCTVPTLKQREIYRALGLSDSPLKQRIAEVSL